MRKPARKPDFFFADGAGDRVKLPERSDEGAGEEPLFFLTLSLELGPFDDLTVGESRFAEGMLPIISSVSLCVDVAIDLYPEAACEELEER